MHSRDLSFAVIDLFKINHILLDPVQKGKKETITQKISVYQM